MSDNNQDEKLKPIYSNNLNSEQRSLQGNCDKHISISRSNKYENSRRREPKGLRLLKASAKSTLINFILLVIISGAPKFALWSAGVICVISLLCRLLISHSKIQNRLFGTNPGLIEEDMQRILKIKKFCTITFVVSFLAFTISKLCPEMLAAINFSLLFISFFLWVIMEYYRHFCWWPSNWWDRNRR